MHSLLGIFSEILKLALHYGNINWRRLSEHNGFSDNFG
jgi:hypothetical protein